MATTLRQAHAAMGSWFEVILRGDDLEHLDAVASSLFDEIDRIERLLSRHDPRSETSRVNREAPHRPVRVNVDFLEVLQLCHVAWETTSGHFDAAVCHSADDRPGFAGIRIDAHLGLIAFDDARIRLDFGGIGKGYALDRAAEILTRQGIEHALLHGGTSSILARGDDGHGQGWPIAIRNPFGPLEAVDPLLTISLFDEGFSCSAVFGHNPSVSDLINPRTRTPLSEPCACVVLATSAAEAEFLSTGGLAMGKSLATEIPANPRTRICWIENPSSPRCFWLVGGPDER